MTKQSILSLKNVWKSFPSPRGKKPLQILEDITLDIGLGEIVALLGPSGCGKSTVLNLAAGFDTPDQGNLFFSHEPITAPSAQRGVVFQSAVLFPWLTVKQNIIYGLKLLKLPSKLIDQKYHHQVKIVGLENFGHYYPHQLSGGMQQRAALARVLIMEPQVLLMDEPFASLDAQTRITMQKLLLNISRELNPSILFITHDIEEALFLSDKVLLMSALPGRIKKELIVPFPKPRQISLLVDPKFLELKGHLLEMLFKQDKHLDE